MPEPCTSCIKIVDGNSSVVRFGKTSNGKQRFRCKNCRRTFIREYHSQGCRSNLDQEIASLIRASCGIRDIARYLSVSTNTVRKRILKIAAGIRKPMMLVNKTYEVDELCTFIGRKSAKRWIVCALRKEDKQVVDFRVGTRTNKTIQPVIQTLELSHAKRIYTDGYRSYRSLVDLKVYRVKRFGTNHIERMNLNLRTHLKRLNRRSICFSKSLIMLNACLRIYFWGNADLIKRI